MSTPGPADADPPALPVADDVLPTAGEVPSHALLDDAVKVATGLRVTSTVLAVPALAVSGAATLGFCVLTVLLGVALADAMRVARWVLLALAVAGLVATAVFVVRVVVTWRAARDRDRLATELLGLVDLHAVTTAMLADLAELTSSEGGLRAVSRARALWRVLRRLDITEHVAQFPRAQWFVPPEIGTTWALAQVTTWGGLAAWVLVPVVAATRAVGWL